MSKNLHKYVVFNDSENDPTYSGIEDTFVVFSKKSVDEDGDTIPRLQKEGELKMVLSIEKMVEVLEKNNLLKECEDLHGTKRSGQTGMAKARMY